MPQSITLTVSHLPTSTSFFLSALQPLSYIYRGRSGSAIGFGPAHPLSAPPDFWITQETPGVPAGAAHVAFPAKSREAVREFFRAAVKAGGLVYGEPRVRDGWGYYSAAVVDMDGNSVEAVHRPETGVSGEEDKENDERSLVRSMSLRAPSVMSRGESAVALSEAPARKASPPKVDAFDRILNEAKNTADKAREFVDHVRPKLEGAKSSPAATQINNAHTGNGRSSDAIVGTLLGVAAGAALHYAFVNRSGGGGGGGGSDPESEVSRSKGRRPSVQGRSMTSPSTVSRSGGGGRYITMEDNDYASTIRPSGSSRRGSIDSGIGISPPSTTSKASKASGTRKMKLLEAPPPSSYRGPSTTGPAAAAGDARSQVSARSKRSASLTRGASDRERSSASRRRSSVSNEAETVLHIRETVRRVDTFPSPSPSHSQSHPHSRTSSKPPPPSRASSHAASKAPSSHSKTPSKASTVRPENHPLPPSRAATWADGMSEASFSTARPTKSVIGKVNEIRKMKFPPGKEGELTPMDSVSQVSSVRGSRRR